MQTLRIEVVRYWGRGSISLFATGIAIPAILGTGVNFTFCDKIADPADWGPESLRFLRGAMAGLSFLQTTHDPIQAAAFL
jgi:hypothetical protein